MSAMQRTKGATYEREVCGDLFQELGVRVSRNLGQARDGGNDIDVGAFRLECKRRARIGVEEWLRQCEKACAKDGHVPVVVMRGDGCESMILMRAKDFWPLMGGEIGMPEKTEKETKP